MRLALTDITERKRVEAELRVAATAFESQEGMFVTDAATTILRVNQAFTEVTGFTAAKVVGRCRCNQSGEENNGVHVSPGKSAGESDLCNSVTTETGPHSRPPGWGAAGWSLGLAARGERLECSRDPGVEYIEAGAGRAGRRPTPTARRMRSLYFSLDLRRLS